MPKVKFKIDDDDTGEVWLWRKPEQTIAGKPLSIRIKKIRYAYSHEHPNYIRGYNVADAERGPWKWIYVRTKDNDKF